MDNMIYDLNRKGEWWEAATEEKVKGELSYNIKEGPNLQLFGTFDRNRFYPTPDKLVLGNTMDGPVTIVDCKYQSNQFETKTGQIMANYEPSIILTGHHFNSKEEIKFSRVHFKLFNLREWLAIDGLVENEFHKSFSLQYERPPAIPFSCFPGCNGKLSFDLNVFNKNYPYVREIEQFVTVKLKYDSEQGFQKILNDIFIFVGLLTLCSYEQSYPLSIVFYSDMILNTFKHGKLEQPTSIPVGCIYQNSFYKDSYKILRGGASLVQFETIKHKFSQIVSSWYENNDKLGPVIRLILNPFQNKYSFKTEDFLDVVKSLEAFHRILFCQNIPKKNKFSLEDRVLELVAARSFPYFDERVKDVKKFTKEVVKGRDDLTHLNSPPKRKSLQGKELFDLSENLKLLLLSCIFQSIGISPAEFESGVKGKIY